MQTYAELMDQQWTDINAEDRTAKEAGELVGRYIKELCADSHAYYKVVKVRNQTVTLKHIDYCDGWTLPMIESMGGKVPLKYVLENIEHRDRMDDLFNSR